MLQRKSLPAWRSLLYVPANVPRFVDKAHERGADAIILDLEDSVPLAQKSAARDAIESAAPQVARNGADVLVRINRPLSLAVRDVEAAVQPGVRALMITKTDGPSHVRLLDELVTGVEAQRGMQAGHTAFVAIVETLDAFLDMPAIFRASDRIVAAVLGSEDLALACDMAPSDETLLAPKQQLIIAARACGILPLGFIASVADYSDLEKFRAVVERSKRFGFAGATCVHPSQVKIVNEVYTPLAEEVEAARRVVEADAAAQREGRGSTSIDGKMIDVPVVERARRVLARSRS